MKLICSSIWICILVLGANCASEKTITRFGSVYIDLRPYFNNDGIAGKDNPTDGNLDTVDNPHGSTFPAEALPDANTIQPVMSIPGMLIAIPPKSDGKLNNVACNGQILSGFTPQKYSSIWIIGTGVMGEQTAAFSFRYKDGTVENRSLTFRDWCAPIKDLDTRVVFHSPYRYDYQGNKDKTACSLYAIQVPIQTGRFLDAVQLPRNRDIHVFALTALMELQGTPVP